ncbi:MAG: hypothetical protein ACFFDI_33435 [Promethearchaeota archaeon]
MNDGAKPRLHQSKNHISEMMEEDGHSGYCIIADVKECYPSFNSDFSGHLPSMRELSEIWLFPPMKDSVSAWATRNCFFY